MKIVIRELANEPPQLANVIPDVVRKITAKLIVIIDNVKDESGTILEALDIMSDVIDKFHGKLDSIRFA